MRRIVDLSMPVHGDMLTFPRVPPPALCVYESHEEFAERIGAAAYGVTSLTASNLVVLNDHTGTHCDSRRHIVPEAGGADTIPTGSATRSRSATSSSSTPGPGRTTPRSATERTIPG
jgi:kynurenine formamidase